MWLTLSLLLLQARVPTFATQVQLVGVTITATDTSTGRPVGGLTSQDFVIYEDDVPQRVIHFEQEEVPASVVVLLDTSVSMRSLLVPVRDAAARLVRSLRPADEVQVASFDERYHVLHDFTADHEVAAAAFGDIRQGESTSLNMALYVAARQLEERFSDEVERRRILILLSDGEDTRESLSSDAVMDAIRRSGIVCYVVHIQRTLYSDSDRGSVSERARQFIERLVYETGGRIAPVPFPYDPLVVAHVFSDIGDELGTQYHLAYVRSGDDTPGWHTIGVVPRSRNDIRLRYRRGYYVRRQR